MGESRAFLATAIAVLLLAGATVLSAEEGGGEEAPGLFIVHYDHVEPSMAMEYEANGKEWVAAFAEKGMGADWTWWAYSRPGFVYAYVFAAPNYAYLDGQPERQKMMAETLGEEKMKELMEGAGYIRSHYSEILKAAPELSYRPKESMTDQPGFARVGVHHVKPGMGDRFKELVKRVVTDFGKAEAALGFDGYEVQFGEGSFVFVTLAKDASQFYAQPESSEILAKAEGEEAAAEMFQEWRECITDFAATNWTFRPELSYTPGAPAVAGGAQ